MDHRQQNISVTLRKKQPYVILPHTVARCPWLGSSHKLLLIVLWTYCDYEYLNGCVSYGKLAHDSKLNERTVSRLLKDLQSLNVISIGQKTFPSGQTRPHYTIHNDIFDSFKDFTKPVDKPCRGVGIMPTPPVGIMPRGGGQNMQGGVGIMPTPTIHQSYSLSDSEIDSSIKDEDQTPERDIYNSTSEADLEMAAVTADLRSLGLSLATVQKLIKGYSLSTLTDAYYRSKGQGHNPAGYFLTVLKNMTKVML